MTTSKPSTSASNFASTLASSLTLCSTGFSKSAPDVESLLDVLFVLFVAQNPHPNHPKQ